MKNSLSTPSYTEDETSSEKSIWAICVDRFGKVEKDDSLNSVLHVSFCLFSSWFVFHLGFIKDSSFDSILDATHVVGG